MPEALVTGTRHRWIDGDEIREADQGETINVSAEELERGIAAGTLARPGSTDLGKLTVDELDALAASNDVADYPADGKKADRVAALEAAGVQPPGE